MTGRPRPWPREPSAVRWVRISWLLHRVERCVESAARLDAHDAADPDAARWRADWALERQLGHLERRLDQELDRLTAERLLVDLAEKQARWGPAPAA